MGSKSRIFHPIEAVTLEHLVPVDHVYRQLERTLDLTIVRELVADYSAAGGRPSIDPGALWALFFKLQLVLFFEGLRSERQLLAHAADRLSIRWYLGYDLHEPLPDHSSLTRNAQRAPGPLWPGHLPPLLRTGRRAVSGRWTRLEAGTLHRRNQGER